jgi:hypothetical protein
MPPHYGSATVNCFYVRKFADSFDGQVPLPSIRRRPQSIFASSRVRPRRNTHRHLSFSAASVAKFDLKPGPCRTHTPLTPKREERQTSLAIGCRMSRRFLANIRSICEAMYRRCGAFWRATAARLSARHYLEPSMRLNTFSLFR